MSSGSGHVSAAVAPSKNRVARGHAWIASCVTAICLGCSPAGKVPVESAPDAAYSQQVVEKKPLAIPTTVGVRQRDGVARPIPYLRVYTMPEEVARRLVTSAISEFARELAVLEDELKRAADDLSAAQFALKSKQGEVSRDFNDRIPRSSELPTKRDRDPLDKLISAGAKKSEADRAYQSDRREKVDPLASTVEEIKRRLATAEAAIDGLRSSRNARLFDSLPEGDAQVFTTDAEGRVDIILPDDAKTIVWAEAARALDNGLTERYRWVLRIPGDLDADGRLVLSNHTMLPASASALWNDESASAR